MTELIDIYDADRKPTGLTVERDEAFMQAGQYMMYVLAIIENREGKILITQRSPDKKWAALWWEITGGGARAGETSWQALRREVSEEVGLGAPVQPQEPVYSYENVDLERGDNYFVDIYHLQLDFTADDVTLQAEEAVACKLATWQEIDALAEQGVFLHYSRLQKARVHIE